MAWGWSDLWNVVLFTWWICNDTNSCTPVLPWTTIDQVWRLTALSEMLLNDRYFIDLTENFPMIVHSWDCRRWSNHLVVTRLWLDHRSWIFTTRCKREPAPSCQQNIPVQSEQEGQGVASGWGRSHSPPSQWIKMIWRSKNTTQLCFQSSLKCLGDVTGLRNWLKAFECPLGDSETLC